jgi:hypothetical protein
MSVWKVPSLGKTNNQEKAQQTHGNPTRAHNHHNFYRRMEPLLGGKAKTTQNKATTKSNQ